MTEEALAALEMLTEQLRDPTSEVSLTVGHHLTGPERDALRSRVDLLMEHRIHPWPAPGWPAVPWPPV